MLLAPFLAVALVISLAAAVSYLPVSPQASTQNLPSDLSTPLPQYNAVPSVPNPSEGIYSAATPAPAPVPSTAPTAVPESGKAPFNWLPILSITVAIILGIVAAIALVSEKNLKKELEKN
jgi:hypothetical protein